jgi:hypothetical protein
MVRHADKTSRHEKTAAAVSAILRCSRGGSKEPEMAVSGLSALAVLVNRPQVDR